MKYIRIFFSLYLVVFCLFNSHAQTKKIPDIFDKKYWAVIDNSSNNLRIGKYEITNALYAEFIRSTGNTENKVKSNEWTKYIKSYPFDKKDYYHQHGAFANYPVVNIEVEDAQAFAEWLTDSYKKEKRKLGQNVVFRLPTEEEWESAAKDNSVTDFPWGGSYIRDSQGDPLCNYLRFPETSIVNRIDTIGNQQLETLDLPSRHLETISLPMQIGSFPATSRGLFDISGNVSELTSTTLSNSSVYIAKGGSYLQTAYWSQISPKQEFNKANPYTGFRLVLEVIDE